MPKRINIEGVGLVDFPDEMPDDQIAQAIETEIIPVERRFREGKALRVEKADLAKEELPSFTSLLRNQIKAQVKTMASGFATGAAEAVAGPLEAVSVGAEALGRKLPGVFDVPEREEMLTAKAASAIRAGVRSVLPPDEEVAEEFVAGTLAQAAGSMAGFVGGGLAGRAARLPTALVTVSLGASAGGVEGYRRAKAAGAPDETAFEAFLLNAGVGTTEAIPIAGILGRLNRTSGGAIANALVEGGQEAVQQLSSNVIAQQLTDEEVEKISGVVEGGAAGTLTGFFTSLLMGKLSGKRLAPQTEKAMAEAAEIVQLKPKAEQQATVPAARRTDAGTIDVDVEIDRGWIASVPTIGQEPVLQLPPPPPTPLPVEPSDQALFFTPPGLQSAIDWLKQFAPRTRSDLMPVDLDTDTPVPDFQPYDVNKRIANRYLTAAARIPGFGWLFDPRSRADGEVGDSVRTRQYETQVGRAVASAVGETVRDTIDSAFIKEPGTSRVTNIQTTSPDQSTYISDVFEALQENPNSYILTPEQRRAFKKADHIVQEVQKLARRHGIAPELEEDDAAPRKGYFPRIALEREGFGTKPNVGGGAVGAKQFFEKTRLFESEQAGAAEKVKYEPSIERRLVTYVERTYRKIADKRLAEAVKPMGETVAERKERFSEAFPDMEDEKIIELATNPRFGEARVNQPAFRNIIFPEKTAEVLNAIYGQTGSGVRQGIADINNFLKGIGFTFDFAAPFLQGQVLAFRDPKLWSQATGKMMQSFLDPATMQRYLANPDNQQAIRELSQMGVQLGNLQDMMAALKRGQIITRIPKLGPVAERFGRAFSTFTDYSMIEMWKTYRETTPRDQWPIVAETLQTMLFHGRIEEIGVSPSQALMERVVFLASSYLRGTINFVAGTAELNVTGDILRRAAGSWMLGGVFAFAAMMALRSALTGEEFWDEFTKRLDPSEPDFGTVPVKFPDGRVRNIGPGGSLKSVMRLFGKVTDAAVNHPEKFNPGVDDNPIMQWLRGKLAPLPGTLTDVVVGKDFLGNDVTWLQALAGRIPAVAQRLVTRPGEPAAVPGDIIPGILGLNAWPEGIRATFARDRDAEAKRTHGKPYEELPLREMFEINQKVKADPVYAVKQPTSERLRELAYRADIERQKRITEALPKEQRKAIEGLQLTVPGYDASLTINRDRLPLTRTQTETYEKLIIGQYEQVIGRLLENPDFANLEPSRRQEVFNKILGAAKEKARAQLMQSFGKPKE